MAKCDLARASCWRLDEGDDFTRTLTWLQTKNGPPVDLTGMLFELWIKPTDPAGTEFLVSSNGTTTPNTSITVDPLNGKIVILVKRVAIPNLKLTQGATARLDRTDAANVKSAQFSVEFDYRLRYGNA